MNYSTAFSRVIASLLVVLSAAAVGFADTLRLKDGSTIKGKVVSFGNGKFTIALGEGARRREMVFAATEIESISFDESRVTSPATAGSNRNTSYNPAPSTGAPRVITADNTRPNPVQNRPASTTGSRMGPISWSVKVLADATANGWTNSGFVAKKGQRIKITGEGEVSLGRGKKSAPFGDPDLADNNKLLRNVATGALVAVIGDDNNDFIYIGSERTITADRDGPLFLGINEGVLEDNSGHYNVKIEILPDSK